MIRMTRVAKRYQNPSSTVLTGGVGRRSTRRARTRRSQASTRLPSRVSIAGSLGKSTSVRALKSGGAMPNVVGNPMSFVGSPTLAPERLSVPVATS